MLEQRLPGGGFAPPRQARKPAKPFVLKPSLMAASQGLMLPAFGPGMPAPAAISSFLVQLGSNRPAPPPKVARLPARPGCGYVNVGSEQIPLDCSTPTYGLVQSAAQPLVHVHQLRKSEWHAGAADLPSHVDHRSDGEEGAIRNQGAVGACTAFSLAGAIDHAIARRTGEPGAVSAMHVWSRYHTPSMELAVFTNRGRGLTSEMEWPYNDTWQKHACSWVPCDRPSAQCRKGPCGAPVHTGTLSAADARPRYTLLGATVIHRHGMAPPEARVLMDALAKGQDIWIAMGFSYSAFDSDRIVPEWDGLRSVVGDFDPEAAPGEAPASHAMTIVGYAARPSGTYFLLRNSWGTAWGDKGYAWIHESTLTRQLHAAYIVQAEAISASSSTWKAGSVGACPPQLAPDSATGQCVPLCSDGSARHDGVCPDLADCPEGYVNLEGTCVVAAPSKAGTDPSTGTVYRCAAAGCVFQVPPGPYCQSSYGCTTACAAPKFRLAFASPGYLCTE